MRIENQMLSRMSSLETGADYTERSLSSELDFFFDNVMDTVVDFFQAREEVRL